MPWGLSSAGLGQGSGFICRSSKGFWSSDRVVCLANTRPDLELWPEAQD